MPLDPHAAASPVQWLEWDPAAFDRARAENKPILLRISAVWCHWCHVMDESTDADPVVAERINEWFVPVRVDNDERPDINDRYNLGGWPTTAFLTPDGDLITGGTYFPALQFSEILERIHEGWTERRDQVDAEVQRLRERRHSLRRRHHSGVVLDGAAVARTIEAVLDTYDWRYAGFGTQPKFPQPEAIRLLLHAHAGSGSEAAAEAAARTLQEMRTAGRDQGRNYGLYDHAEGGFFRYSTTRDWSEPHFEKMCEDNARLALAYLDAFRLFGDELYSDTVRGIFTFVLDTLSDTDGGAYGSQDADGEADYYGLTAEERAGLPTPYIDRRFYTDWNGMLATAALRSAATLAWSELERWAIRTIDRLDEHLSTPEGAMRHVFRPEATGEELDPDAPLLLSDQAWWILALLAAYQSTGELRYRTRAEVIVTLVEKEFFDASVGAFLDHVGGSEPEGALSDPHHPLAANAALAEAFVTFASLGGGDRWTERAEGALQALQADTDRLGLLGAPHALAAALALGETVQVHLVGPREEEQLRHLRKTVWSRYLPMCVTEMLDPSQDGERLEALGYPTDLGPRAYVCVGDRCLDPVERPSDLERQLDELRRTN